ncbi:MAG: translocation/assembly module TamB domain-containing protein [Gammaproteobacteria bacterium]|nr:translocation/assembly module TamB domain-containing protein [Gammaproteobacteria bacterium]
MLEQSIDRPMLAHSELAIPNGSYSLYGQRLSIENGKLLFLGNPLNPAVDIRAVRQTSNALVGLQLNGTIRNLQGQLFSVSGLPESEILSLLVTGRSFQNAGNQEGANMLNAIALLSLEKGNGLTNSVRKGLGLDMVDISTSNDYRDSALGLGKYLRPNLFMRYDIGLFDRENTLTLEYILTERVKLEVQTGVSQSVDLTYTVEK